jgi:hypothetical protein
MLKNASNKHTKYVVNQKLQQFDVQVSFRELFIRITVDFALQSKIIGKNEVKLDGPLLKISSFH